MTAQRNRLKIARAESRCIGRRSALSQVEVDVARSVTSISGGLPQPASVSIKDNWSATDAVVAARGGCIVELFTGLAIGQRLRSPQLLLAGPLSGGGWNGGQARLNLRLCLVVAGGDLLFPSVGVGPLLVLPRRRRVRSHCVGGCGLLRKGHTIALSQKLSGLGRTSVTKCLLGGGNAEALLPCCTGPQSKMEETGPL